MNSIYLIKTLNLIALIFIPLNFIFGVLGYKSGNGMLYLWLCFIGFLINHFHKKKSMLKFLFVFLILLPLITARSTAELIYLITYCMITIASIVKGLDVVKYDTELDLFRKALFLCLGILIVSFILGCIRIFADSSAHYAVIYLVASILLLRNLRFMEYNKDSREGSKINNRYSIAIVIFSLLLSTSYIRELMVKFIKNSYLYIMNLFMNLFAWFFVGIGYLASIAANALIALIKKLGANTKVLESIMQNNNVIKPEAEQGEVLVDKLLNNQIFRIVTRGFVILLVVYIILRLLRGMMDRRSEHEDYSEEKEFVLRSNKADKKVKNKIFDFLRPRGNEEKIRQYYQKYIKRCMDKNIDIKEIDTTEEIRNKSANEFDKKIIDGMRSIYIKIRYGEKKASIESVKEMGDFYTSIRKQ